MVGNRRHHFLSPPSQLWKGTSFFHLLARIYLKMMTILFT